MTKNSILITGGAGFVGSHLTKECLRLGWDVSILYQPEAGLWQIQDLLDQVNIYPVKGETGEIIKVIEQVRPNLVFHLASMFISKHTPEDILTLIQSNIAFGTQILEAMAQQNVPFLVNTGTSWQNFENESYNPVNLYAATKQAFEDILIYYLEATSLQAITLKLFDTYGPADARPKLFSVLRASALNISPLEMSPWEQLLDLVYIDDVVQAFIVAAERLFARKVKKHEVYAVSSNQPIPLNDLVETYRQLSGKNLVVKWGARPYREREVMIPWNKGKLLPGWRPKINLEQGISMLLDYYNE